MSASVNHKLDLERVFPIFVLVFVDVLGLTIILPLLHLYGAVYGAGPLEIGLVAAAFPLAQLVGVPVMGALSDRFGRRPLLLISQVTTCISFIMLGTAGSLAMVIFSRLFDGLFGANIATAQAALSDVTGEETRAQGLGLTGAAFGLGFILGPVISIIALELTNDLSVPAFTAAVYSFISILITYFVFKETLPPEKRGTGRTLPFSPLIFLRYLRMPQLNLLMLLIFAQQLVFFGFEAMLGVFVLSRLGLLGGGNAVIFIVVGFVLVTVQVRYIGRWSRRWGEHRLVWAALGLLALGLVLVSLTPEQPHPFYVQRMVQNALIAQAPGSTEAIIGTINIPLPTDENRGVGGVLWMLAAVVPVAVGAGLIRPSLNSLMTRRVPPREYGSVLGTSASFISAANAAAPLLFGLLFQQYGPTLPFLGGGLVMALLALLSFVAVRPAPAAQ